MSKFLDYEGLKTFKNLIDIPVYTNEEYELIKDEIPEGKKFIIIDDQSNQGEGDRLSELENKVNSLSEAIVQINSLIENIQKEISGVNELIGSGDVGE